MLYDGEQYPLYETCPKCGGLGDLPDWDEMIGWLRCTRCMGDGKAPDRRVVIERCRSCGGRGHHIDPDIVEGWPDADPRIRCDNCMENGYAVRWLTRREKIVGFLQLAWPPDIENPRHYPAPERRPTCSQS